MLESTRQVKSFFDLLSIKEGDRLVCVVNDSVVEDWKYGQFHIVDDAVISKRPIGKHKYFEKKMYVTVYKEE